MEILILIFDLALLSPFLPIHCCFALLLFGVSHPRILVWHPS